MLMFFLCLIHENVKVYRIIILRNYKEITITGLDKIETFGAHLIEKCL